MGRGNVSVSGPYEGLYYIDNDHIHAYRRDDPLSDEPETRLMGELDYGELTGGDWLYDDWGTGEEEDDILECFMDSFGRMFPSFSRVHGDQWIRDGAYGDVNRRVIMESKLFYVAVQDNEWSLAVELIQKEPPIRRPPRRPPGPPLPAVSGWHEDLFAGAVAQHLYQDRTMDE